jgi:uncharacterized protein (TIGR03083 family)
VGVASNSAAALIAELDDVWSSLEALGRSMGEPESMRLTACPGWSVAMQFAHVAGGERMLVGWTISDVETPPYDPRWVSALADGSWPDVLRTFNEIMAARRAALATMTEADFAKPSWTPVRPADYRRLMQIRVFDCWVHEQDVRDAVGRPGHETGPAADQAMDEMVRALGYIVGKKAAAAEGSSVRFELTEPMPRVVAVAVTDGRARVVEQLGGPPTALLRLSSTAFSRLACGRVDPEAVLSERAFGGVAMDGDAGLAERVVRNLSFTF